MLHGDYVRYIADAEWRGRKSALTVGLLGTGFSLVRLGFAGSFEVVVGWRLCGEAVNRTWELCRY
jgi:hypothetical protein